MSWSLLRQAHAEKLLRDEVEETIVVDELSFEQIRQIPSRRLRKKLRRRLRAKYQEGQEGRAPGLILVLGPVI